MSTERGQGELVVPADVVDMVALRFPSWEQYRRDEFAHRIAGIIQAEVAAALEEAAEKLLFRDHVEWALAGECAGLDAARIVREQIPTSGGGAV